MVKSDRGTDRAVKRQLTAMLEEREAWWAKLAIHGDPLPQTNVFEAYEAGFEAAVRRIHLALKDGLK